MPLPINRNDYPQLGAIRYDVDGNPCGSDGIQGLRHMASPQYRKSIEEQRQYAAFNSPMNKPNPQTLLLYDAIVILNGITTYLDDESLPSKHQACLELERYGMLKRSLAEKNFVIWYPVKQPAAASA